jgi:c-di-GMP-binding flagellar brake protein YcgR
LLDFGGAESNITFGRFMTRDKENRKYERYLIADHFDCRVLIRADREQSGQLSDISKGGMMVLFSAKTGPANLKTQQQVSGELLSDNTALAMRFSGRVAWTRDFQEGKSQFTTVGIEFAQGVELPAALIDLLEAEG